MSDAITLRPACTMDAAQLGAILSDFNDTTPWMPRLQTPAQDRAFIAGLIGGGHVRMAERAGRTAGFAAVRGDDLVAIYVQRDARGQGCGTALLTDQMAQAARLTLWTFQANTRAQAFYRDHGFCEIARTDGDNEEGLPDIRMHWQRSD